MGEFDVDALTVTVGGLASFGVVQATRVMVDWFRELVEPQSAKTIRWAVTVISLINITLWALAFTSATFELDSATVPVGEIAAWVLGVGYLTTVVAWTVNSYHIKEQLRRESGQRDQ